MKTIWKYPLQITDSQTINLPDGAKILSVNGGNICLWALVDTEEKRFQAREIRIFGTGQRVEEVPDEHFIGTVQVGVFVWHVFEAI